MKIHYFQHVPFEGLGCISDWINKPGNSFTATRFYEDQKLPFVDICDFLIVMGGPMGVYDEAQYPWLKKEKEFIAKALDKGKKVIGICLGAQLLAEVLGAKVYTNDKKEIGWFPVTKTGEGRKYSSLKNFPDNQMVFHWHRDTFELPKDSIHLLRSEACENQSFIYKDQALALQFHLEMRQKDISSILENCRNELQSGPYIQTEEQILNEEYIEANNRLLDNLLASFVL